jgi:GT2 family glycosyltransferase
MHRTLIREIGLPLKEFFLDRDDIEFTIRARKNGFGAFFIPRAQMLHPHETELVIRAPGYHRLLSNYAATPWRARLKARNSVWTYRLHTNFLTPRWLVRELTKEFVAALYQLDGPRLLSLLLGVLTGITLPLPLIEFAAHSEAPGSEVLDRPSRIQNSTTDERK